MLIKGRSDELPLHLIALERNRKKLFQMLKGQEAGTLQYKNKQEL